MFSNCFPPNGCNSTLLTFVIENTYYVVYDGFYDKYNVITNGLLVRHKQKKRYVSNFKKIYIDNLHFKKDK